jgi:hypothetical protein
MPKLIRHLLLSLLVFSWWLELKDGSKATITPTQE